jgi:hypothetical protein
VNEELALLIINILICMSLSTYGAGFIIVFYNIELLFANAKALTVMCIYNIASALNFLICGLLNQCKQYLCRHIRNDLQKGNTIYLFFLLTATCNFEREK